MENKQNMSQKQILYGIVDDADIIMCMQKIR